MKETNSNRKIKRRQFLNATAVTTTGVVGASTGSASQSSNKINLTIISNVNEVDTGNIGNLDYSVYCKPAPFDIMERERKLVIYSRSIDEKQVDMLKNNNKVIYNGEFLSNNSIRIGKEVTKTPTIHTTNYGDPAGTISLDEEYSIPETKIDMQKSNKGTPVKINGKEDLIVSGEHVTHAFKPKEVIAKRDRSLREKSNIPSSEKIKLKSKFELMNYGGLEIEIKDSF